MEVTEGIGSAIVTLAKKLDIDEKEMRASVEKLMKDKNLSDGSALADWKRRNRGLFRSKNYDFIVFGKTNPRTAMVPNKEKNGEKEERSVANIDIVAKTETGLKAYVISFWDDRADSVEAFDIGTVYKARLALGSGGFASLIQKGDKVEVKKVKESTIPALDQLLTKIRADDIALAADKVKAYGFYSGFVTRSTEKGMELDSMTALPVMCWTGDVGGDIPEIEQGKKAIVFGRPYVNGKGEINISVHAVFTAPEEK